MSSTGGSSAPLPSSGSGPGGAGEFGGRPQSADWRRYARIALWTVLIVLIALLLIRNGEEVTVDFVFFTATVRLFVALAVAMALGLLLGLSVGWLSRRRHDKRAAAARAKK